MSYRESIARTALSVPHLASQMKTTRQGWGEWLTTFTRSSSSSSASFSPSRDAFCCTDDSEMADAVVTAAASSMDAVEEAAPAPEKKTDDHTITIRSWARYKTYEGRLKVRAARAVASHARMCTHAMCMFA